MNILDLYLVIIVLLHLTISYYQMKIEFVHTFIDQILQQQNRPKLQYKMYVQITILQVCPAII